MKRLTILSFLLLTTVFFAQVSQTTQATQLTRVNEQTRYNSESRLFYVWNEAKDAYDQKDTEFENSIIDIREINTHGNGYIIISLVDDGKARLYHGSIISYERDENGNSVWVMRSKNARGKLVLDAKARKMTYSFESNEKRYVKVFVFNLTPDMLVKED
jgi:hypothetical protein